MLATQQQQQKATTTNSTRATEDGIKVERQRRESTTSESSLEHLDLGRTPKKLIGNGSGVLQPTSTPHTNGSDAIMLPLQQSRKRKLRHQQQQELRAASDLDDVGRGGHIDVVDNDDDDDDDAEDDDNGTEANNADKPAMQRKRRKQRRSNVRVNATATASIVMDYSNDASSLRKKFRFNRSSVNATAGELSESGFVDASAHSGYLLNASTAQQQQQQQHQHQQQSSQLATAADSSRASSHSSGASSPHGLSSAESGIGAGDEHMKYLCPICEVVSATPHEFTNHIRCHNYANGDTENFTCRICSKVLSSASSLDRHVLVHTGERPFNCKYCHLTFTTNGNMHRHMRTHKQHQQQHQQQHSQQSTVSPQQHQQQRRHSLGNVKLAAAVALPSAVTATAAALRFNGSSNNNAGESYESDGSCSTELSSANSQSSKRHSQSHKSHNNNNNNNSHKTNNNNNNNSGSSSSNVHDDDDDDDDEVEEEEEEEEYDAVGSSAVAQHLTKGGNLKRQPSDDDADVDVEINVDALRKQRRVKTTINNNIIDAEDVDDDNDDDNDGAAEQAAACYAATPPSSPAHVAITSTPDVATLLAGASNSPTHSAADSAQSQQQSQPQPHQLLSCPVCGAEDFDCLPALCAHMDTAHADIPAKCRECDVVFRTHRQLQSHPCTQQQQRSHGQLLPPLLGASSSPLHEMLEDQQPAHAGDAEEDQREDFFRQLYLKNKAGMSADGAAGMLSPIYGMPGAAGELKYEPDSKDLADIQSILNMTSSSSTSNFLRNFEHNVNTPSSQYSVDGKDEEEAQDAFTSEFRRMKLRGEFPCKLCTAVFPNLRALKGHNRVHLSAVGPAGPFRCNMCPYAVCDKAALVRHMRTHNGDRPYECAVCNYAFTTKANCERHLRNRHGKTTREEVKRAIVYHPAEDASCDESTTGGGKSTARLQQLYGDASELELAELSYRSLTPPPPPLALQEPPPQQQQVVVPAVAPVSQLKNMLLADAQTAAAAAKPALKIQVKSLDQLVDKPQQTAASQPSTAPIDLSMDVLDLSKKPTTASPAMAAAATAAAAVDLAAALEQQQVLLAQQQQQLFAAGDPATQYMQQFFRNLMFQQQTPFPFFGFMPPGNASANLAESFMTRMLSAAAAANANGTAAQLSPATAEKPPASSAAAALLPQISPLMAAVEKPPVAGSLLPPRLPHATGSSLGSSVPLPGGPVKMVIKNGVLMPKQKQRRYRTERPFACEHCSARFTLRSNMERHVKQQHPQFYAQRQRSGHHVMRGRGAAAAAAAMSSISQMQVAAAAGYQHQHQQQQSAAAVAAAAANAGNAPISEQVKYAILAQQLKAHKDTDLLQQALAHGSSSVAANQLLHFGYGQLNGAPAAQHNSNQGGSSNSLTATAAASAAAAAAAAAAIDDDEPKLIIDEDEQELNEDDEEYGEEEDDGGEDDDDDVEEYEEVAAVAESSGTAVMQQPTATAAGAGNEVAKQVAETILEQAIKAGKPSGATEPAALEPTPKAVAAAAATPTSAHTMKSMIAQAESVAKSLKDVASSPFKDESQDLVPVAKLVDNATSNQMSFNNYFRPSDVANHMEQSDEEGLVASGSASESNNSGTEDVTTSSTEPKKKSAYSLAPNRVSCPYCQRMFPWSSSLRRHILTHTGQKPFKCSHCPLLFTTKSNCDRHLLRKHGNVESAMSVYVPTEDVNEPIPVPKSVEEIEQQQRQREEEERRRKAAEQLAEQQERERERRAQEAQRQRERERLVEQQEQQEHLIKQLAAAAHLSQQMNAVAAATAAAAAAAASVAAGDANGGNNSELPYKCHLCECSYGERLQCLEHIKQQHAQEFTLLLAKGAIETDVLEPSPPPTAVASDDEHNAASAGAGRGGKYPDYSNRKVICAFCVRRFWSTEDLRRHMRTHSGERPFQCEICLRKFTLKHSMLRHMKKHSGRQYNGSNGAGSEHGGSDCSDDEQSLNSSPPPASPAAMPANNSCHNNNNSNSNNNNNSSVASKLGMRLPKLNDLLDKANEWRASRLGEHKENIAAGGESTPAAAAAAASGDLIGNLLGISDQGILNKLLSSADEAAKLLGVDK